MVPLDAQSPPCAPRPEPHLGQCRPDLHCPERRYPHLNRPAAGPQHRHLLEANRNIKNITSLHIGQKLTLPAKTTRKGSAKAQFTPAGLSQETWTWPLNGKITSGFGYRTLVVAGSNFHGGLDIFAPQGTLIKAARFSTVYAGFDSSGYGNTVVINHGGGWQSRYSHNSQLLVQVGQHVQNGQAIALVGRTGYATGAHLDYRITFNGRELDPLKIH
ncbi:M23 family metallopeptidase [Deinococcus cellulosilyticus]|uniref:M23ase beta-sheet core domain-containing protein n=1 Tax=Deinococcus cellulosilyticus (strain DSM 18568 / NBRC 106333 / KACC 11606 / 5516J-15) TaxID=1223518 RepID=A0A511N1F0_DEIC1|nr:M23 family metallopeptidase [Deinococcus cellulosilyticus]GEM46692.1 hypothetical protein DC3_23270 [Deinococcus cellulosilyticus NBRC 106333 = KACC 11606]